MFFVFLFTMSKIARDGRIRSGISVPNQIGLRRPNQSRKTDLMADCEAHLELGGGERDRTVDLRLAKPALSQLSYTPVSDFRGQITGIRSV